MANKIKDRTGYRYGRLVALSYSHSKGRRTYWLCKCDCGNERVVITDSLTNGNTKSCGCLQKEVRMKFVEERSLGTHGFTKKRLYSIWKGMKNRCTNINSPSYKDYGDRGIELCEEWMVFENFMNDMLCSYNSHFEANDGDTTIERIDVNGGYNNDNCIWATNSEQQNNKRVTKFVKYKGEEISVPRLSEIHNIPIMTIHNRLNLKWDIEKIINTPVKRNRKYRRRQG